MLAFGKSRKRWAEGSLIDQGLVKAWVDRLFKYGFHGERVAAVAIATLLVENEFESMDQLKKAEDPQLWIGVESINGDELKLTREIIKELNAEGKSLQLPTRVSEPRLQQVTH